MADDLRGPDARDDEYAPSGLATQNLIEQAWIERGVPLPDDAADLMFVAAEAVETELERLRARVAELEGEVVVRDALTRRVENEPDLCMCEDCVTSKLDALRSSSAVPS